MDRLGIGGHGENAPQDSVSPLRRDNAFVEPNSQLHPKIRQPVEIYADQIVRTLEDLGIRTAFGIPGGAICTIFNSLSKSQVIRTTLAQHECGAAYMALGRSIAMKGREMGLCFGTSGPGITNLITGVAAAFEECVPIFVLTGNVATALRGRGAVQDAFDSGIDAVRMLEPVTARSMTVMDPETLVPTIQDLYALALRTRRPVHLNVPVDLAGQKVKNPTCISSVSLPPTSSSDTVELARAALAFVSSERPLIFAGNGVKTSGNGELLRQTIESLGIPLIVTSHAKGVIAEDHPLYFGTYGVASPQDSTRFMEDYSPTAILFLGTRLGENSSLGWSAILGAPETRIHVDLDETQFNRIYQVTHPVQADINEFLRTLLAAPRTVATLSNLLENHRKARLASKTRTDETPSLSGPADPVALMNVLDLYLPDNAVIFTDIGNSVAWTVNHLSIRENQELFIPLGLCSMGTSVCAAIGAKTALPDRPVICITGDCSALMHGTELFTAMNAGIPVKLLVLNDGGHGMVDHGHRILGLNDVNVRFHTSVDFQKFGQALGIRSFGASNLGEFMRLPLDEIFRSPEPALIDLRVDPKHVPPILARTRVLGQTDLSER